MPTKRPPPPYALIGTLSVVLLISAVLARREFAYLLFGKQGTARVRDQKLSVVRSATGGKGVAVKQISYEFRTEDGETHTFVETVNAAWEVEAGDTLKVEWLPHRQDTTLRLVGNGYKLPIAFFWMSLAGLVVIAAVLRWEVITRRRLKRRRRSGEARELHDHVPPGSNED